MGSVVEQEGHLPQRGKTNTYNVSQDWLNRNPFSIPLSSNRWKRKSSPSDAITSKMKYKAEVEVEEESNNRMRSLLNFTSMSSSLFYAVPLGKRLHPRIEMHRIFFYHYSAVGHDCGVKGGQYQKEISHSAVPSERDTRVYLISNENGLHNSKESSGSVPPPPLLFPSSIALVDFVDRDNLDPLPFDTTRLLYVLEHLFRQTAYQHYTKCPLCSPVQPITFLSWFSSKTKKRLNNNSNQIGKLNPLPCCVAFTPRTIRRPVIGIMTSEEIQKDIEWFLSIDEQDNSEKGSLRELTVSFLFRTEFWNPLSIHQEDESHAVGASMNALDSSNVNLSELSFNTPYSRALALRFFIRSFLLHSSQRRRMFQDSIPSRYASSSKSEGQYGHRDSEVHPAIAACDNIGGIPLLTALLIGVDDAFSLVNKP